MIYMPSEKILCFHTEYSRLYRFVYSAHMTKRLNPNISLSQSRMVLEIIIDSLVGQKSNLISRIIELEELWTVDREIIDAMHTVRLLGNVGAHAHLVFRKEAHRALKALFKVMHWYGSSNHRLIKDKDFLADVQFCLAACYEDAIGTEPDISKQLEWLEKSCENGSPFALRDLGIIYSYDGIAAHNYDKAVELLKKSADQGLSDAQYFLGVLYMSCSTEIACDFKTAHNLFLSAADKGNLLAEYALAEYFGPFKSYSPDIPYNPKENFARYNHIVEQGYDDDLYHKFIAKVLIKLGDCYQYGLGTDKDLVKGFECYLKGANRNNDEACYKVGQCFEKGIGTDKDMERAEEYYSLAAVREPQASKNRLRQLDYAKYKNLM